MSELANQTALKSGLRFSIKAENASRAAGSRNMRPKLSPSSAITSSTFAVCPPFINRLVSMSDDKGLTASFLPCAWA